MFPRTNIFGFEISTYGLFAAAGIAAALAVILLYLKRLPMDKKDGPDYVCSVLFGFLGGLIGSKLLYIATVFPQFVSDFNSWGSENFSVFLAVYMNGGFVFFGGFYGAVIAILLYSKFSHFSLEKIINAILPALPIGHAIGRLGCLSVGCCYGVETQSPVAVIFHESAFAPADVPLVPVQLYEAVGNFLIFIFIIILRKKRVSAEKLFAFYLLSYGALRFIDEFFRGDTYRGFFLGLSTSQWISIMVFVFSITMLIIKHFKKSEPKPDAAE
jgi:phosphatidylglycerol:prolipoprotein diacylglycerol transferase